MDRTDTRPMLDPSLPRLLIIALAEASPDLVLKWSKAGRLPTFSSFMSEGYAGPLRTEIPIITPQIWATLITGKNPGRHGIFDYHQRGPDGRFRQVDGSHLREKTIWEMLADRGLRCGIVNVPLTYPPRKINGFMISGQDAPGPHRSIASPPELYDEMVRQYGPYRLKEIFPGGHEQKDYPAVLVRETEWQTGLLEGLVAGREWEFFLAFYSVTAMAQHYFWADMESADPNNLFRTVIEDVYRYLDEAIARLIRAAGENTNVLIISESGAGRLYSGVQINTWLAREGFQNRKGDGYISASGRAAGPTRKGALEDILKKTRRRISPSALFWVNRLTIGIRERIENFMSLSEVDWSNTVAFSRGKEGDIFINLKGRDRKGIVAPGREYEAVCERIKDRLMQLVDPGTGQKAVARVQHRSERYHGPWVPWAPDLIIEWRDTAYMPTESDRDRQSVFVPRWRGRMNWPTTGSHRIEGLLMGKGPSILPGKTVEEAGIADLVPTCLYLLGQDIPADLEGRVIPAMMGDG